MSLENLLKERNDLREQIENVRKANEKTVVFIDGFFHKIYEYVQFCRINDISFCKWHEFNGLKYLITCNNHEFSIYGYDCRNSSSKGMRYVELKNGENIGSLVGKTPVTLESVTERDGTLKSSAKWFEENIPTIMKLVDEDMEICVKEQIEEAKKMLGGSV